MKFQNILKASAAPAVIGLSLLAQPALAQDAEEGDAAAASDEVIVVTGSRIVQPNLESSSPVTVTSGQEIAETGYTRLEDVLVQLPQVEAAQNAFISNGATGTATLDLRGMGAIRTLVLVNGRRLQPGSVNSTAADINQIPGALVQRIDVLTGGASSVYGADAVAGVVNFILDDKFEGVQMDAGVSYYMHDNDENLVTELSRARGFSVPTDTRLDGQTYHFDFTVGGSFGEGGHAVAYATYRNIKPVRQGARDHSACALNATGTACGGSYNSPVANFDLYPFVGGAEDYSFNAFLTPDADGNLVDAGPNLYNYAPINYFQRPDERFTLGAMVNYEVSDAFNPFVEVMYMNNRSVAQIAESGTFFAEQYDFSCDRSNPLFTDAQYDVLCDPTSYSDADGNNPTSVDGFAAYIGKRNVEGGGRQNIIQHDSFRILGGSRGALSSNWSYEGTIQYGQSSLADSYVNDFFLPSIADALNLTTDADGNIVCVSGGDCIPYLVAQQGGVTADAANNLSETATRTGVVKEFIANAFITGDLGFGIAEEPISMVLGAEYRNEIYSSVSDYVYENGLLAGQGGPTPSVAGQYDVKELFTEASIPLLQDSGPINDLRVDLGYRYSNYSVDGGGSFDTHTYKAQASADIADFLRLRGGYNRAVRAPNAPELFSPQSIGLWGGEDPCAGATPELSEAQCALTGVSSAQYGGITPSPASQYNGLFGGNPNLAPEKADTITAGIVITPNNRFSLSVDYWQIKMDDVIGTYPAEQQLRDCATGVNPAACDRINRAPNGSLFLGQEGYVVLTNDNLGTRNFSGIDIGAGAQFGIGAGDLSLNLTGSYLLNKEFQDYPGGDVYDCAGTFSTTCFVSPNWRHTFRVAYKAPEVWTLAAKWRYFGSVDAENPDGSTFVVPGNKDGIKAYNWFDLSATADVTENFSLTAAVNNIFDTNPPLVGVSHATNGNTYAGYYDTLGRYISLEASVRF